MIKSPLSRRAFLLSSSAALVFAETALPGSLRKAAAPSVRPELEIYDSNGALSRVRAPIRASVLLSDDFRSAAAEGQLALRENSLGADNSQTIPTQILTAPTDRETRLCWVMPPGPKGRRVFRYETVPQQSPRMVGEQQNAQYTIRESSKPVLRYNYNRVEPGDLLKQVSENNRKYAVPRSDYIHPLYGPSGEELTKDWSVDHPHHRGIYWAWPEVDWREQRGDLHALQKVFARPTGKCEGVSGPVFGQLRAENLWLWEGQEPIVREEVTIRVYAANECWRSVDLEFRFEALREPVLVARRGASHYGGLNIRLSAVKDQRIAKHTDPAGANPRRAWADLSGTFAGATEPAGVTVIQVASNPDYPGDWIDYPELNWLQPTFPASGSRYEIRPERPLILRFRLCVHADGTPTESKAGDQWQAANCPHSPLG